MATTTLHHSHPQAHPSDAALLNNLIGPTRPTPKTAFKRRDAALDPLLIAAAAASGPHITRHHYNHDFFPGVVLPLSQSSWDWTKWNAEDASTKQERKRYTYVSRQAPRRLRVLQGLALDDEKENDQPREIDPLRPGDNLLGQKKRNPPSISHTNVEHQHTDPFLTGTNSDSVEVKCMARTRIPTPHGPVFLHLYHNNRDNKEHLAIVIDPAQLTENSDALSIAPIRSRSLDAVWSETETEWDRITRGAYVGRLSPTSQIASKPTQHRRNTVSTRIPPPLIRIHSECFTGETVGSMRCDCGEQLDEAIRLISQKITIPPASPMSSPTIIPGRGAVIYLRQEGRGIGLLSKIRAYNLQDIGHDTVTANLMLGHKADERGYEIAGAILRDLGLGSDSGSHQGEGVRILTNNPEKVQSLEKEGLKVVERVSMIPRSWQGRQPHLASTVKPVPTDVVMRQEKQSTVGVTLVGGGAVYGEDLDKYLRTKVLRMGHMLPLWLEDPVQ